MVFFTCNACGQSIKKNKVEKHYQIECRNCEVLSCIDCGRDFVGDEYLTHTSCISEAQKYQGALYQESNKGQPKGEKKQQEWLERIRTSVSSVAMNPKLTGLLEKISEYPNIPRKKPKFVNFVRNSLNLRDNKTLDQLWETFSAALKSPAPDYKAMSVAKEANGESSKVNGESSKVPEVGRTDAEQGAASVKRQSTSTKVPEVGRTDAEQGAASVKRQSTSTKPSAGNRTEGNTVSTQEVFSTKEVAMKKEKEKKKKKVVEDGVKGSNIQEVLGEGNGLKVVTVKETDNVVIEATHNCETLDEAHQQQLRKSKKRSDIEVVGTVENCKSTQERKGSATQASSCEIEKLDEASQGQFKKAKMKNKSNVEMGVAIEECDCVEEEEKEQTTQRRSCETSDKMSQERSKKAKKKRNKSDGEVVVKHVQGCKVLDGAMAVDDDSVREYCTGLGGVKLVAMENSLPLGEGGAKRRGKRRQDDEPRTTLAMQKSSMDEGKSNTKRKREG